ATVSSSNELHGDLLWVKLAGNGDVNVRAGSKKVLTTSWGNGKILVQGNYNASSTFRSDEGHLVTSYRNQ
ncbi:MAG TPA: hypothetical protein VFE57_00515, partial [Cyclobacteriaceae bacterium]|nr:hypothetical protein [Cyclobacteriaceae bacterium]